MLPNPVERFYAGGPRIARFRGVESWSETAPEDWIASTTSVFDAVVDAESGTDPAGLSVLADGRTLRDAVAADPEAFLGPRHAERFGPDLGVLVKLLDAGRRIPVHWHPGRGFVRTHLHGCYGKSEGWVVLEAEPGAEVRVGWRAPVDPEQLSAWFTNQDIDAILRALNAFPVSRGDTVFVPAGTPHTIGEGILLLELQEPTDLSVLLEWKGIATHPDGVADLGLGSAVALSSVDLRSSDPRALRGVVERPFPSDADQFFRAEIASSGVRFAEGPAVAVVIEGKGTVATQGGTLDVQRGDTALLPFAAGAGQVSGPASVVLCRPSLEAPRSP
jgi:mannose-6-phosphate isomerase